MSTTTLPAAGGAAASVGDQQFVLLNLGNETYGIEIGLVHGIIMPQAVTAVPKMPSYVKGVTNLRGSILPVIDMRSKFGLSAVDESNARSVRFVVVETNNRMAALIVDAVSEVARIPATDIEPPSTLVASAAFECISGVGKLARSGSTSLVMMLDVDKMSEFHN